MYRFGLKLWSNNEIYVKEAVRLYEKGIYHYIELYVIPDINDEQVSMWKSLDIPYIIHAPHFGDGLNLAKREKKEKNRLLIKKAQEVADLLKADKIIVHPGIEGDIRETVQQLKEIYEPRIIMENKPCYALYDGLICNGSTIEEIKYVLDNVHVGFCLDIGHAFCAATAKKIEPLEYLKQFIKLMPKMYHLTDGDYNSLYDRHDHLGKGNYDIKAVINILPEHCDVTVETVKDFNNSLRDFENDINYLNIMRLEYKIKVAHEDDILDIFKLSNDPIVRQNSFNQEPIVLEDHIEWFNRKLKDENCIYYIIRDYSNSFIGQVRFDKIHNKRKTYVVSISLTEKFRGKGIGYKILKEISEKLFIENKVEKIYAYIKEDNQPSLRSFQKAGYKVLEKEDQKIKLEYYRHENLR